MPAAARKGDGDVKTWLALSRAIDAVNTALGRVAAVAIFLACMISAGNAGMRYAFSISSNAWLEIQWYLFALIVMLGASVTLRLNEHVRVDLVYMSVKPRTRIWIDTLGTIFFLLPATIILTYMSWRLFYNSWIINEFSGNAGGLLRWPVKALLPVGFLLLTLQGISELIKHIAALKGLIEVKTEYEVPLQ